jgi:RND family efflux transporter MFP subunit
MRTSHIYTDGVSIKNNALLLAMAAAFLASSCSRQAPVHASNVQPIEVPAVAIVKASTEDLSHGLVLTGEFRPYQEVDVMAKVAGFVKEIKVDIGDRVSQGQLLATLEVPEMDDDLRRADAAVVRARAEVTRAQDEQRRAESAYNIAHLSFQRIFAVSEKKPGLVAQQDIDEAKSRDLVADAQVSAAKSALAASREQVNVNLADMQRVKTLMDYTRVTAPFPGVVTRRYADKGSMIQAGTASQSQAMPLVKLSENTLLRLILPVPESAVPTVHIGQLVEVKVPTLKRSFPGKVVRFAGKLSLATRTMDTEVDVTNSSLILMPGMYAEVNLTLDHRNQALALPVVAVDMDNTDSGGDAVQTGQVMIVTPNNRVEKRRVTLGIETANYVEIRSGLNEGDSVVLSGRAGLQPGQEVRPKVTAMTANTM